MLRLRLTIDAQPRSKKGQPPQSTTGVARISCTQLREAGGRERAGLQAGNMPDLPSSSSGRESAALTQKRRRMSRSSGFSSSPPAVTVRGSRAMPQIGQLPGRSRTICGCIGQVYSTSQLLSVAGVHRHCPGLARGEPDFLRGAPFPEVDNHPVANVNVREGGLLLACEVMSRLGERHGDDLRFLRLHLDTI